MMNFCQALFLINFLDSFVRLPWYLRELDAVLETSMEYHLGEDLQFSDFGQRLKLYKTAETRGDLSKHTGAHKGSTGFFSVGIDLLDKFRVGGFRFAFIRDSYTFLIGQHRIIAKSLKI